jgi:hypothetical protein
MVVAENDGRKTAEVGGPANMAERWVKMGHIIS